MRRRLTIAIMTVAAVAVTLFAVPLAFVVQRSYRDQEVLRLQRDAVAAARKIDLGATAGDPVELPQGRDRFTVYDAAGHRAAGGSASGPPTADAVVRDAIRARRPADATQSGLLVAAVPLLTGERVNGAIRVERADAVVRTRTHRAWLMLGGGAVVIVLLAAGAAVLLGRRLAVPLERLARSAGRLGDGDFTVRAPRGGIAEVDEVAVALDATAERLDELVTRERAFSTDASHQLRTPLAALRLELEAMQLDPAAADIDAAVAQVDRLQQTIDTLIAVARDTPRPTKTTDLVGLLEEVEGRWRGRLAADGRPLHVDVGIDSSSSATPARATVVQEILDVLIDNAFKHGNGAITVTLRTADTWRAIDVSDEGEGLREDQEAVFARRTTPGDGHGIGLALASSLAHAEGGRLTLTRASPRPVFTLLLAA